MDPLTDEEIVAERQSLRRLIQESDDAVVVRIAYCMEHAIDWLDSRGFGYLPLAEEVHGNAEILKQRLGLIPDPFSETEKMLLEIFQRE